MTSFACPKEVTKERAAQSYGLRLPGNESIHFQDTKRAIKKIVIPASEPESIAQCLLHVPEVPFQWIPDQVRNDGGVFSSPFQALGKIVFRLG